MFRHYSYDQTYNDSVGLYTWKFEIVDSEFREWSDSREWPSDNITVYPHVGALVDSVIDIYERRKLNVAANIVMALRYICKTKRISMAQLIEWSKDRSPKFESYMGDIEKYLVLI